MNLDSTKTKALVFTSIGHFVNDGTVFFVPVIADLLAALKGLSLTQVAEVLFVYYAFSTISSVFVARRAEASGEVGRMVAIGIALLGVGLLGFDLALVNSEGSALLIFSIGLGALMGFASAFYHPLSGAILQSAFSNSAGGRALGMNGALGSIGRALYPSLFFVAALVLTQSGAMVILGAVALFTAVIIWFGLRQFKAQPKGKDDQSVRGLLNPTIVALTTLSFIRTASMLGVGVFVPEYLTFQRGLGTTTNLGFVVSAMLGAAVVSQPLFGYLLDRVDKRLIFLISSIGAGLSVLALTYVTGPLSIAILISFGFFIYTGFPLLIALASDYVPKGSEVMGNAVIWGLGQTGGNAVGSLIIGAIALNDLARLDLAFRAMVALAIVSAFFVLLIPKAERNDAHRSGGTASP